MLTRGRVALVLLSAGLFTLLGAVTVGMNAQWLVSIDTALETWSDKHRTDRRGELASGVWTFLGSPLYALTVSVVCGGLISLLRRSPIPVVLIPGAVGVGVAIEETLKAAVYPHGFPSGHVTVTTTMFGMIAVCLAAGDSRLAKVALGVLVAETVFFVAALAVYTGAHTFTDAIGGMILGTAILASGAAVLDFTRRNRYRRPGRHAPVRTPARATVAGRPGWALPDRLTIPGPDEITRPLPRL